MFLWKTIWHPDGLSGLESKGRGMPIKRHYLGHRWVKNLTMDQLLEFMEKPQDMISTSHWRNIPRFSRLKYMQ
jgi:hypothetical protein